MRKLASICSIALFAGLAACSTDGDNQMEVPDVDVNRDTVAVPEVNIGTDTATVRVPDIDVVPPGDTTRRDTTRPPAP